MAAAKRPLIFTATRSRPIAFTSLVSQILQAIGDKIFHATIAVGCTRIMASDVGCVGDGDNQNQPPFTGFALALRADDVQQAQQFLDRLAEGGSVLMPMTETFFAQRYAIVTDPFGVTWKVMLEKEIS